MLRQVSELHAMRSLSRRGQAAFLILLSFAAITFGLLVWAHSRIADLAQQRIQQPPPLLKPPKLPPKPNVDITNDSDFATVEDDDDLRQSFVGKTNDGTESLKTKPARNMFKEALLAQKYIDEEPQCYDTLLEWFGEWSKNIMDYCLPRDRNTVEPNTLLQIDTDQSAALADRLVNEHGLSRVQCSHWKPFGQRTTFKEGAEVSSFQTMCFGENLVLNFTMFDGPGHPTPQYRPDWPIPSFGYANSHIAYNHYLPGALAGDCEKLPPMSDPYMFVRSHQRDQFMNFAAEPNRFRSQPLQFVSISGKPIEPVQDGSDEQLRLPQITADDRFGSSEDEDDVFAEPTESPSQSDSSIAAAGSWQQRVEVWDHPVYLLTRDEYSNPWHAMTDWHAAFQVFGTMMMAAEQHKDYADQLELNPDELQVIIMDNYGSVALDDIWSSVIGKKPVLYASQLREQNKIIKFRRTMHPIAGYHSVMYKSFGEISDCHISFMYRAFNMFVKLQLNITSRPLNPEEPLKVVLVVRGSRPGAKDNSVSTRVVANQNALFDALVELHPHSSKVDFGQLSFREQVEVAHEADLLVGVHGASMTNMNWMPPWGYVLEMFANGGWGCYQFMTSRIHFGYESATAQTRHSHHGTEIEPEWFARTIEGVIRNAAEHKRTWIKRELTRRQNTPEPPTGWPPM